MTNNQNDRNYFDDKLNDAKADQSKVKFSCHGQCYEGIVHDFNKNFVELKSDGRRIIIKMSSIDCLIFE